MKKSWLGKAIIVGPLVLLTLIMAIHFGRVAVDELRTQLQRSLEQEVRSTEKLANGHSLQLRQQLQQVVEAEATRAKDGSAASKAFLDSDFHSVFLLEPGANAGWQLSWNANRPTTQLPQTFFIGLIGELPLAKVVPEQSIWFRVSDPSGQPMFAMLISAHTAGKEAIAVGLLSPTVLSAWSEAFKGSARQILIMDERGYALAFSSAAYVGASLQSIPAAAEILKQRAMSLSGSSRGVQNEAVVMAAVRMTNSNAYLAVMAPTPKTGQIFVALALLSLILLIAVAAGSFWLNQWYYGDLDKSFKFIKEQFFNLVAAQPLAMPPETQWLSGINEVFAKIQTGGLKISAEGEREKVSEQQRMTVFQQIGTGLTSALTGPLVAILSQARLIRSQTDQSEELKQGATLIEREARRARDILDNLLRLTGSPDENKKRLELQDVLLAALAAQKTALQQHSIRVVKNFALNTPVLGNSTQLQAAFEELIKNAIEAMLGCELRELTISTSIQTDRVFITFADTGKGIAADQLPKVFEPFFTTKPVTDEGAGLGLSVVKGILKNHNATIALQSNEQQGTRAELQLPLAVPQRVTRVEEAGQPKGELPEAIGTDISVKDSIEGIEPLLAPGLHQPISGSKADALPAPPHFDEITLVAPPVPVVQPEELIAEPISASISVAESPSNMISEHGANNTTTAAVPSEDDVDSFVAAALNVPVRPKHPLVRQPKVRPKL